MSYFGKCYLTGPDAQAAADWIFSACMDGAPGKVAYTCMLNSQAGIEADLTVSVLQPGSGSVADPSFQEERGFYIAAAGGAACCRWNLRATTFPRYIVLEGDESKVIINLSLLS